ncbi:MAG: DUF2778 domain-containing protein [Methylocapsa sp.]|nr:DUF2778 domain-containing protein [Methylocapsa sp.]
MRHVCPLMPETTAQGTRIPGFPALMREVMNGLYVYSIMVAGFLLALVISISRRHEVSSHGQAYIAILSGAFLPGVVIMAGLSVHSAQQNRNPTVTATPSDKYSQLQSSILLAQQNRNPSPTAIPSDNRVVLENFDALQRSGQQPSQAAPPYGAPESGVLDTEREITSGPLLGLYSWTAVYDISAHTVYLPDGTKLEAHSGRGSRLDDPRYVREHMRGATPPNVYELALREKTFHGVQALRLKPLGAGDTFGRSGLLAHTYMLGPRGESNGCVVFKNYNAFLQAFQNGQVKRLVVVDNLKVRTGYELALAQACFARLANVSYWSDASVSAQHGKNLADASFREPPELPARPANAATGRLRVKERAAAALMSAALRRRETHHGRGRSAKIVHLIDRRVGASARKFARRRHRRDAPVGILREAHR